MTAQEFDAVRKLLLERSAISLDVGKEYLVESRLAPILRQLNIDSVGELVARAARDPTDALRRRIVEAMVTTETLFFRDHHPFEALRQTVIPDLMARRAAERRLNIWCAASSTGQEPYSLAMLLREHFPELARWTVNFIASDISQEILARAREGRYNQIEVNRGLPASLLVKYFEQRGTSWQLRQDIRESVDFREINLAREWPLMPAMDLVLIRNVMIYFEVDTKKVILRKIARLLRPDGYMALGGAESTLNLDDGFRRVEPFKAGLFQLVG